MQAGTIRDEGRFVLRLSGDEHVSARSVVIASGARYRRLEVENLDAFEAVERALLGLAAGRQAVRRPGGGAGRRRQFGRPGGGLSSRQGRQGLAARARAGASSRACRRYLVDRIAGSPMWRW